MNKPLIKPVPHDQERKILRFQELGFKEEIELGRYNYTQTRRPLMPHAHDDCMEICYLEKGNQVYETGGDIFALKGGDIFLTFPGEVHSTADAPEERGRLYWLMMRLPGFRASEKDPPFLSVPRKTAAQLTEELRQLPRRKFPASRSLAVRFSKLMDLGETPDAYTHLRMESEMRGLLLDLIECAGDPAKRRMHPGINRVLQRVEEDLTFPWDNASMAAIAGLSESHFKASFKKMAGNPPADYLARRRIEMAKQLLRESETPVTDVAFACGFSSSQYFATVFKRYTGVTPTAYRGISADETMGKNYTVRPNLRGINAHAFKGGE